MQERTNRKLKETIPNASEARRTELQSRVANAIHPVVLVDTTVIQLETLIALNVLTQVSMLKLCSQMELEDVLISNNNIREKANATETKLTKLRVRPFQIANATHHAENVDSCQDQSETLIASHVQIKEPQSKLYSVMELEDAVLLQQEQ